MNVLDPIVLGLLAVADMAVLVQFRRRQARRYRMDRMQRSLTTAIHQAIEPDPKPIDELRRRLAS